MECPELPARGCAPSNSVLLDHTEEWGKEPAAPWLSSLPFS